MDPASAAALEHSFDFALSPAKATGEMLKCLCAVPNSIIRWCVFAPVTRWADCASRRVPAVGGAGKRGCRDGPQGARQSHRSRQCGRGGSRRGDPETRGDAAPPPMSVSARTWHAFSDVVGADLWRCRVTSGILCGLTGFQISLCSPASLQRASSMPPDPRVAPEVEVAQPLYARYCCTIADRFRSGDCPRWRTCIQRRSLPDRGSESGFGSPSPPIAVTQPCTVRRSPVARRWETGHLERSITLPSRASLERDVEVVVPAGAAPGDYPGRSNSQLTGDVPPAWTQVVEDICVVTVGKRAPR